MSCGSSVTLEIARLQHSVRIQSKAMHWSLTGPNRDCMFRRRPSVVRAGPTEAVDSPLHCFQPQALAMERGSCILRDDGHVISPITYFATAWSRSKSCSHEMHAMRGHRLGLRKAHLTTVGRPECMWLWRCWCALWALQFERRIKPAADAAGLCR